MRSLTANRHASRGQALVELGIIILVLVGLGMGIVEFGRMFMIVNVITHAARDGARAAAATPPSGRGSGGTISNMGAIQTQVLNQIATVTPSGGFSVTVAQPSAGSTGGIPMVTVSVSGAVPYVVLPGLAGSNLSIARTVSFRDEGR